MRGHDPTPEGSFSLRLTTYQLCPGFYEPRLVGEDDGFGLRGRPGCQPGVRSLNLSAHNRDVSRAGGVEDFLDVSAVAVYGPTDTARDGEVLRQTTQNAQLLMAPVRAPAVRWGPGPGGQFEGLAIIGRAASC